MIFKLHIIDKQIENGPNKLMKRIVQVQRNKIICVFIIMQCILRVVTYWLVSLTGEGN